MFNDRSGQLMLISAFMLAMMVVTISLMLNNIIYSSNLAYVGFMDQSRYDDISLKQVTAQEMKYAYDTYHGIGDYSTYLDDYADCINKIMSIKGRYIALDNTGSEASNLLFTSNHDVHTLSIYSQSSKASYSINTGTYTAPTTTYVISEFVITSGSGDLFTTNGDKVTLKVTVKDTSNNLAPNQKVVFSVNRYYYHIKDKTTGADLVDLTGVTDSNGVLTVDYSDNGGPGFAYVTAKLKDNPASYKTVPITCLLPTGVSTFTGSPYHLTLIPTTAQSAPYDTLILDGNDRKPVIATVKDSNGYLISGVEIQFDTNIGVVMDPAHSSDSKWETDITGQPKVNLFFYGVVTTPGLAHITGRIITTNPDWPSDNGLYYNCIIPASVVDPTIDSAHTTIGNAAHGSDNVIKVAFTTTGLTNVNIAPITEVSVTGDVRLDSPVPYFAVDGGINYVIITTKNIPNGKDIDIVLRVTFIGTDSSNAPYSKTGTLHIYAKDQGSGPTITIKTLTFP